MKTKLLSLLVALVTTTALWASNTITYTATSKLTETTDTHSAGLHTNAFNVSILSHTFSNGTGTITFSGEITTIGSSAFSGCRGLTSITIPNSVTTIGDGAFVGCSGLTSITIPNSVTTIGSGAFEDCSGLKKTNYTGTIADWCRIKFDSFYANPMRYSRNFYINDVEIKDLVIPNSVTTIGYGAFAGCSGLTSVTIPNSVTTIGSSAFSDCSGLTSMTIPNSVTTIGDYAFNYVNNIVYSGTATGSPWGAKCMNGYVDGYLVYSDATKTTLCGCSSAAKGEITIPNSVTTIGNYAFVGCSGLTSITIPNSVTTIGEVAFAGCSGLTSPVYNNTIFAFMPTSYTGAYTIPDGITQIALGAFAGCSGLTSVTIPNSVTTIGDGAFDECYGLTSVTIGNSVTTIGDYAFAYCSGLTSVTCYAIVPPSCGNGCFAGVLTSIPLYVPEESVDVYKTADEWKEFTNILPTEGTGLNTLSHEGKDGIGAVKMIMNGQLYILRDNKLYNAAGAEVK